MLEGGEFAGFVGSSVDITDLKDAEESLRNADRVKDEFLAALGHELRNPLAAISNAAYLLGRPDERPRQSAVGIIERQTRNMMRIVDDLLDVSRITHGKINLRLEPVNLETGRGTRWRRPSTSAIGSNRSSRLRSRSGRRGSWGTPLAWSRSSPTC